MILGTVKETFPGESRVGLVPRVLPSLTKAGLEVLIESGAGLAAGFTDDAYSDKGARICNRAEVFGSADLVIQVRGLGANPEYGRSDLELMRRGQILIATFEPLTAAEEIRQIAAKQVSLLALEMIPRITRAQSMDVLSSMATVAAYKAVLLGAQTLVKMFPMMMTAAGTITPARVLIIGVGVAGLQAIATSKRLGAKVQAYDVRPAVREEVESLGAKFVEMELEAGDAQDAGGYAKDMGDEFLRKQRELMTRVVAESDVVITTAAVPGKKAPLLVTADMVRGMSPGSVIVDMAAERGGNCELTKAGETVVEGGVTILGPTNIAATVPYHASQMFSKNATTLALHITKDGKFRLDTDDEIVRETLVTHEGAIPHPRIREAFGLAEATT